VYSNNAQLENFTQRVKNLVTAAGENKFRIVKRGLEDIKECFERMIDTNLPDNKISVSA